MRTIKQGWVFEDGFNLSYMQGTQLKLVSDERLSDMEIL